MSGAQQAFQALAAAYESLSDPVVQHRLLRAASTAASAAPPYSKRARKPTEDLEPRCRSWAEVERELQRQEALERSFLAAQRQRYSERRAGQTLQRAERCAAALDERCGVTDNLLLPSRGDRGTELCGGGTQEASSAGSRRMPSGRWDHDDFAQRSPEAPHEARHEAPRPEARCRRHFTEEPEEAPAKAPRPKGIAFVAAGTVRSRSPTPDRQHPASTPESATPLLDDAERLLQLLLYLRTTYHYCLFCGCGFSSHEELEACCPGVLEGAHDRDGDCCLGDFD